MQRSKSISPVRLQEEKKNKKEKQFSMQLSSSCHNNVFHVASKTNPNDHHKHTPLRKSALTAGFKYSPGFCSAEIIPALNPRITVRHHPVCGYRLQKQSLGAGAGRFHRGAGVSGCPRLPHPLPRLWPPARKCRETPRPPSFLCSHPHRSLSPFSSSLTTF